MGGRLRILRYVVILAVAGIVYWQRVHLTPAPDPTTAGKEPAAASAKIRGYDRFDDAHLVDREGNDGDSFLIRAGGREFELRLYFVDAPESYLSDRFPDQRRRVAEQARAMGGITVEQAVEVGRRAKDFTRSRLQSGPFTVYTQWEKVFDGDRYYGFIELPDGTYLGSKLVEEGLARIHTKGPGSKEKPVPTPDGATFFQHRGKLEALERRAQAEKRGAWAY